MNSAAGSFGLSFGLAFAGAIMLATLSIAFTNKAEASKVLPPADQQQVAEALEDDAEVMSNTQLERLLADEPEPVQDEIIRINTRRKTSRPSGGAADPAPRRPRRAAQLVPDDAPARPDAIERRRGERRGLTSRLAVGVGQLRFDRQVDVAVDVVGADAVDDPVGFQDRENLRLDPR